MTCQLIPQISVLIDNIEDIEEDPETAQILSSFEGEYYMLMKATRRPTFRVRFSYRCMQDLPANMGYPRSQRAQPQDQEGSCSLK